MQIREAEHRHRAELAAEQERVREAHDMVALVQFGAWRFGGFRFFRCIDSVRCSLKLLMGESAPLRLTQHH